MTPHICSKALHDQILDIDGDIKSIAQVPGSDQKIVAIDSDRGFALARLNADLSVDTSFGHQGTGYVFDTFDPDGFGFNAANQVTVVGDKILVLGSFFDFLDVTDRVAVARYHADGSLDTSFNGTGRLVVELPHSRRNRPMRRSAMAHSAIRIEQPPLLQADGALLFFFLEVDNDHRDGRAFLIRLSAEGQLDTTFNQQGFVHVQVDGAQVNPSALMLQSSNILVCGGTHKNAEGTAYGFIARFTGTGDLDTSFNNSGLVVIGNPGLVTRIVALALDGAARIIATGTHGSALLMTARLPEGAADPSFNDGAVKLVPLPFEVDAVKAMVLQNDLPRPAVLVAVNADTGDVYATLVRVNLAGTLDGSFGAGTGFLMAERESEYKALQLEASGAIIAAGYVYQRGYWPWIRRFGINGERHQALIESVTVQVAN